MKPNESVSIRGKRVRKIVSVMNHLPGITPTALHTFRSEHERDWKCPDDYTNERFRCEHCYMELLTYTPVNGLKISENSEGVSAVADGSINPDAVNAEEPVDKKPDAEEKTDDSVKKKTVIYQLHGGGYVGRLENSYRSMAVLYSEISDHADVLSLDYRVTPDDPFPAALLDAEAGYNWILEQGYERIIVVGDSAGGGLTLALVLYLRDNGIRLPDKVITMSAWTDLTSSGESYDKNFDTDPVFGNTMEIPEYAATYIGDADAMSPYISPLFGDFKGFPETLMQVGELEVLLSDTLLVAEKMEQAGVKVIQHTYPGMFHDFQKGLHLFPESTAAWEEIEEFINS